NHHLDLFARIKPEYMSGDETDRDEDNKRIRPHSFTGEEPEWMSEAYREFMHTLDDWHYDKWANGVDGELKGGNPPRTRNFCGKVVKTKAPKGLWRNCYNAAWLAQLKPYQRRGLHVIEEDYNFEL
ncbi:hypothetical protein BC628DRAFT_1299757, partial [Trametes gibbosa]